MSSWFVGFSEFRLSLEYFFNMADSFAPLEEQIVTIDRCTYWLSFHRTPAVFALSDFVLRGERKGLEYRVQARARYDRNHREALFYGCFEKEPASTLQRTSS